MKPDEEKEITREEVRKEFQLERMILFSDAVFAIVITLMAIEIRLPHGDHDTEEQLIDGLKHLVPVFIAYLASFCFIGTMWYRHLQMFSLLKDYNKDLVIRNMCFLFCIGLFPFSASIVSSVHNNVQAPLFIYMGIILACKVAQYLLQDYIFKHPELRLNTNVDEELARLKRERFTTVVLVGVFLIVGISNVMITNPENKPLAMLWTFLFPVLFRIYKKRNPQPVV